MLSIALFAAVTLSKADASVPGTGTPATDPATIRVATFNLRNYLESNRMDDGRFRMDYPKPESEKQAVQRLILAVRPDILALQEIGDERFLNELIRDLARQGLDYPEVAWMQAVDLERHIAVIARIPIDRVRRHVDLDFKYFAGRDLVKRGLLEVRFTDGAGEPWTLFTLHLKSRYTTRDDDPGSVIRRTGEARAIRDYIRDTFDPATDRYLIAGDFNDTKRSAPVRRFLSSGDTVLSQFIPCHDSRGEVWTYYYSSEDVYSRVDYLLASPGLLAATGPLRGHIVDYQPATAEASDHRMLYVDLPLPPAGDRGVRSIRPHALPAASP